MLKALIHANEWSKRHDGDEGPYADLIARATSKVITTPIRPPIPVRDFDWSAMDVGYEPGDPIGYGPTEQEAINNLNQQKEPA
jgi:hypothetical protein